ncbi:unnamed protein product [Gordionus sp. m RMFG-2023]|uniref:mucin-2-like n=1 Tax=Gordionus sp. m RMFG-2023 TaxID=3053472 RepID=UPI0030E15E88
MKKSLLNFNHMPYLLLEFLAYSWLLLLTSSLVSSSPPSSTLSPTTTMPNFCAQWQDCQSCLRDHMENPRVDEIEKLGYQSYSNCHFKVCYEAKASNQMFTICHAEDQEVPCPDHIEETLIINDTAKCPEIVKPKVTKTTKPADTTSETVMPVNTTIIPEANVTDSPTMTTKTTPVTNTTVNPNTTTTPSHTNATTVPTVTTLKPTNVTNSTIPTTSSNPTATPSHNVTITPITAPTAIPSHNSKNKFSLSSFIGGMCLMAGISTLIYFGTKYYRSNAARYRQF